jgi:hypothetical protein
VSKPYDATSKELLQTDPVGWAAFLGVVRPPEQVKLIDSDLSTVTAAADKVLRIEDASPWILGVEFQSGSDTGVPRQLLMYNGLLQERHKLPVASALVVLAPRADSTASTGAYQVNPPFGPAWEFRYTVLKLWQMPVAMFLNGPLAVLPLAPLADVAGVGLPAVAQQVGRRLHAEADLAASERTVTILSVLLKLRYDAVTTEEILRSVYPDIRESPGYKVFFSEGRIEEARSLILRMGHKKLGPPTPGVEAALNAITDLARLEALSEKLLDVNTWDELLKDA